MQIVVAVGFSFVYATTKIFNVGHAGVYTADIRHFNLPWGAELFRVAGNVRATATQIPTVVVSLAASCGSPTAPSFASKSASLHPIRSWLEIARLQPRRGHICVTALLRSLRSDGETPPVAEHNTRVVQKIADDVLFLHQGHRMAQGSPETIVNDPALAEIYFGGAIRWC